LVVAQLLFLESENPDKDIYYKKSNFTILGFFVIFN
jgi:hypothetical protein